MAGIAAEEGKHTRAGIQHGVRGALQIRRIGMIDRLRRIEAVRADGRCGAGGRRAAQLRHFGRQGVQPEGRGVVMHRALIHFVQLILEGFVREILAGKLDVETELLVRVAVPRQLGHGQVAVPEAVGKHRDRAAAGDLHRSLRQGASFAMASGTQKAFNYYRVIPHTASVDILDGITIRIGNLNIFNDTIGGACKL